VKDAYQVENVFYTQEELDTTYAGGAPPEKFPLFHIDLNLSEDGKNLQFSSDPKEVVTSIMNIFNDGIKSLQEIPQVEQKLLTDLFRSNTKMYLKACVKPHTKPLEPDPDHPPCIPDPNAWVYEAYMKLQNTISTIIEPLEDYFKTFEKYQKENDTLDPEKVLKELDECDPTDWPAVDEL
jgi:hypothetical protein